MAGKRRIVILDVDGLRWDVLYRHLAKVRDAQDAGAPLQARHAYTVPEGAYEGTLLGPPGTRHELRSGLRYLCFHEGMGLTDVAMALASFPTITYSSHATMFTGLWPRRHGIVANTLYFRGVGPNRGLHDWSDLPRAAALQGWCEEGLRLRPIEPDCDDCQYVRRGLGSDLASGVKTFYQLAEELVGTRSVVVHNFYHGASEIHTAEGRDRWWHFSSREAQVYAFGDEASNDEDGDSGAFGKAAFAARGRPGVVAEWFEQPGSSLLSKQMKDQLDGVDGFWTDRFWEGGNLPSDYHWGERGAPDVITLYLSCIDGVSHGDGAQGALNQSVYLAWIDNRLAQLAEELWAMDPARFHETVFVLVADHGHNDGLVVAAPNVGPRNREYVGRDGVREGLRDLTGASHPVGGASGEPRLAYSIEGENLYLWTTLDDKVGLGRFLLQHGEKVGGRTYGALVRSADGVVRLLSSDGALHELGSPGFGQQLRSRLWSSSDFVDPRAPGMSAILGHDEATLQREIESDPVGRLDLEERIRGLFDEGPERRSPDLILLADPRSSFSAEKRSEHGSFAYVTSRVPLLFFGPGMARHGRKSIARARLVDLTPTLLSLVGVPHERIQALGLDGQSILGEEGQPAVAGELPFLEYVTVLKADEDSYSPRDFGALDAPHGSVTPVYSARWERAGGSARTLSVQTANPWPAGHGYFFLSFGPNPEGAPVERVQCVVRARGAAHRVPLSRATSASWGEYHWGRLPLSEIAGAAVVIEVEARGHDTQGRSVTLDGDPATVATQDGSGAIFGHEAPPDRCHHFTLQRPADPYEPNNSFSTLRTILLEHGAAAWLAHPTLAPADDVDCFRFAIVGAAAPYLTPEVLKSLGGHGAVFELAYRNAPRLILEAFDEDSGTPMVLRLLASNGTPLPVLTSPRPGVNARLSEPQRGRLVLPYPSEILAAVGLAGSTFGVEVTNPGSIERRYRISARVTQAEVSLRPKDVKDLAEVFRRPATRRHPWVLRVGGVDDLLRQLAAALPKRPQLHLAPAIRQIQQMAHEVGVNLNLHLPG